MPTLDFDSLRVITDSSGYTDGPSGSITPTFVDHEFGRWTITGSETNVPGLSNTQFTYEKSGTVDFTSFPGIPIDARITRVEIRKPISAIIHESSNGAGFGGVAISILDPDFFDPATITLPSAQFGTGIQTKDYSFSRAGSDADTIFNYISSPITRAQLISAHGTQVLTMGNIFMSSQSNGAPNLSTLDFTFNFDLGWRIRVVYIDPPMSWFIKPTVKIVNGRPIQYVDDAGDVIQAPTDDPPDGYILYGPAEDPVTYVWWSSPRWWDFFILSPIIPDDVSDWTSGVDPPTCTNCLSFTLGTSDILVADASGIYRLEVGKTNDTMYVRTNPVSVVTEDVMIPPPTAKFGFIP